MTFEILPFAPSLIPEAGELLASRQVQARRIHSRLPDRYDTSEPATGLLTAFCEKPNTTGAAAFDNGRMVAYLLAERVADMLWGRAVRMGPPCIAVAEGIDREILRDLYARVADPLVVQGCLNHFAIVPVADAGMVQAFFALAFGIEQIHGIADLHTLSTDAPELPEGMTIRQADSRDRELLESFSEAIWRHQVKAPVWGIHPPEMQADRRKSYGDMAGDKDALVYVAFVDGEPAGIQAYFPAETDGPPDMFLADDGLEMCVGATLEAFRGRGVHTVLTQFGFHAAREAGCRYLLTDWRSTNLLSSRFWPRRGFVPVAYRLSRRVDERILWGGERRAELL